MLPGVPGVVRRGPTGPPSRATLTGVSTREHVTPWFLDEPRPGLAALARRGASVGAARPGPGSTWSAVGPLHCEIRDFTAHTLAAGDVPVVVAGDCCAAIPVVAGLQRAGADATLVWLDAHGDFNTARTSASGFLGGMPLAMLVGRGDPRLMDAVGARPVPEDRIHLGDARDLDPPEARALAASAVRRAGTLDALLAAVASGSTVHVHLDCDVIDGEEVPAQAYPVPGGPSAAEVEAFCRALAARVEVAAVSVCAWHPGRDPDGASEAACLRCLDALTAALPKR